MNLCGTQKLRGNGAARTRSMLSAILNCLSAEWGRYDVSGVQFEVSASKTFFCFNSDWFRILNFLDSKSCFYEVRGRSKPDKTQIWRLREGGCLRSFFPCGQVDFYVVLTSIFGLVYSKFRVSATRFSSSFS